LPFLTAAELLDDLRAEVAQTTFRRKLTKYTSPQILVIDEVGYLSYDHHAADLLYKVVDRRYEKKSIVLTTNLAFRDWNTVFPNATSIASISAGRGGTNLSRYSWIFGAYSITASHPCLLYTSPSPRD